MQQNLNMYKMEIDNYHIGFNFYFLYLHGLDGFL